MEGEAYQVEDLAPHHVVGQSDLRQLAAQPQHSTVSSCVMHILRFLSQGR